MAGIRRALRSVPWGFVVQAIYLGLWLLSLVFGYVGLSTYCNALNAVQPHSISARASDIAYYDLELILIQFTPFSNPPVDRAPPPVPWGLQIARFAAPTIVAFSFVKVRLAVSAHRLQRARLRRLRDHVIVCGSSRAADVMVRRLRDEGKTVVHIDPDLRRPGRHTIDGNPVARRTLMDAGVTRATCLYACLDRGSQNAEIAHVVERIRDGRSRPHRVYALIDDLELCMSLRARRWSMGTGAPRVDFFNPDELAAQAAVRRDATAFTEEPPEIAIAGTGAFGRSVLVEFARQWIVRRRVSEERMRVLLIGTGSDEAAERLYERYAFLAGACVIVPVAEPVEGVLLRRQREAAPPLRRLYLCQEDEDEALRAALGLAAHLRSTLTAVVVRLERMSGLAKAFRRDRGGLFDALGGRLLLVDATKEGCDPARVEDGLGEELARACHQSYLLRRLAAGSRFGSTPALQYWEGLADDLRAANRDQAADIGRKLREIDCLVTPRGVVERDFVYDDEEVEHLARLEHDRWRSERASRGWSYGRIPDRDGKTHPDLVPWNELSEAEREKDREAV
ncbi:MAG TPA: RyR domain-containing protein, partial [Actinocrinis sp.]|uniref:RyR domain-containing protein n=1 Tax=Actinocrinis sp. TaxID=1920516 RepID=UPI002D6B81AB